MRLRVARLAARRPGLVDRLLQRSHQIRQLTRPGRQLRYSGSWRASRFASITSCSASV
ncbi:hypothetical protein [Streptomyces sp. NPDC001153]